MATATLDCVTPGFFNKIAFLGRRMNEHSRDARKLQDVEERAERRMVSTPRVTTLLV